ncbi:nuclear transport factor 2 family protein [Marivirga sp. S37H4]|uniref:Nuclear transport factor 2 family protein n=1 Tax=Marivirga aurantiaca TaxID=2802615 RepID=A0A935C8R7_9BACT|nr:nuclear transport factor 2 family protein [Marivirga aurantiaca]MBK6263848.1 nuclear transport factor 2 family protein [Marivirga aurantiaca]
MKDTLIETVEKFKSYFAQLKLDNNAVLNEIYSEDVIFTDPIHQIKGLENLKSYFKKLDSNLVEGSFQFTDESSRDNIVYLQWEMHLSLKRPKKKVKASGISVLTIEQKIIKHRDYFDAGELFYENVPVLGNIIRFLKKKIAH